MSSDARHHYQPSITRLPSLLCLLVASLGLIALVEVACRRLPAQNANGFITSLHDTASADISSIIEARHVKRQNFTEETTAPQAPAPTNFLPIVDSTGTSAPAPSDFLPIDVSTTSPVPAPPPSNFLPVNPSPIVTSPTTPVPTVVLPNINPTTPLVVSTTQITVGAPAPTNFLPVENSATPAPSTNPLTQPSSDSLTTPAPNTLNPSVAANSTSSLITGIVNGLSYTIESGGVVDIDGYFFNTASPTTATFFDGNVVVVDPTGAVSVQDASQPSIGLTPRDYVVGAFIPTILAVLFSIPWHLLVSAIKEMEPFYQLHSGDGVSAENSLVLDYRASISVVATLKAIRKQHYIVWWSGLLSLIILLLPPLASETVFIGFAGTGRCTATSGRQACEPELAVFPIAARVVQAILAFVALLTFALAIAILQRKSGVYANPLSIAGLATLFQDQRLLEDFRRINPYASPKEVRNSLRGNSYRLGTYNGYDGNPYYGMTLVHNNAYNPEEHHRTSSLGGKKYASVAVDPVDEHSAQYEKKPSSRPWIHPATVVAFALFVLGLMILIIYYYFVGSDTGFERFMSSDAFGVSFLFTAIGVILKMYWTLFDDEIRTTEPYRQLLHGNAKPVDSILLAPHSNPFTGFFHSISHGHFFNAYISLVAVLAEPLIVALANIPFKPGTAYRAYQVATWISVVVLLMMLIGIVWFLCRKRTPGMIRRPDTIADVLLSLCGSHMLGDFRNMAQLNKHSRDNIVKEWNKRYSMGRLVGVDGVEREGVDESMFVGQVPGYQ